MSPIHRGGPNFTDVKTPYPDPLTKNTSLNAHKPATVKPLLASSASTKTAYIICWKATDIPKILTVGDASGVARAAKYSAKIFLAEDNSDFVCYIDPFWHLPCFFLTPSIERAKADRGDRTYPRVPPPPTNSLSDR